MASLGGYANFETNAHKLMKSSGLSWDQLVAAGGLQYLFPSFNYSLTNYATSVLRNAATKNLTAKLYGALFRSPPVPAPVVTPTASGPTAPR